MLVALECRLGGPENCIGYIFTQTSFGFELPNGSIQTTQRFSSSESSHLRIFSAGFQPFFGIFFLHCLYSFLRYSFLHFCFLFSALLSSVLVLLVYQWGFQTGSSFWSCHFFPLALLLEMTVKLKDLREQPWGAWLIWSTGHGDIMNCRGVRSSQVCWRRGGSRQVSWRTVWLESCRSQWCAWVWAASDLWVCLVTLTNFHSKISGLTTYLWTGN